MRATAGSTVSKEVDDRNSGERPPTAKNELSLPDLGAQGDVLLRGTSGLLGGHLDCDPVVLGLCGCCSCECSKSTVAYRILMGAVRIALLRPAVRGRRKRGRAKFLAQALSPSVPWPHFLPGTWSFFSCPPSEFSFLIFRELDHPATAVKSTTRKDGSHVCLTPIPFLAFLNGIVARHLTGVCRLAWSSHWMLFPASFSNRASLQLDPSRDSPFFLQAWHRSGLQTERWVAGCWG